MKASVFVSRRYTHLEAPNPFHGTIEGRCLPKGNAHMGLQVGSKVGGIWGRDGEYFLIKSSENREPNLPAPSN